MLISYKQLRYALFMLALALFVGILAGFCAILFHGLIAFVHNLLFAGRLNIRYDETLHTLPSIWGVGVIFTPVIGGLIVVWLIEHFARDEHGLSVPEIMYKIRNKDGEIRPSVSLAKTLSAAISIGSGASIGREGPMMQIGAAISSVLSDLINLSESERKLLIAAGAAAGMAVIFNAPLAGITFVVELSLVSINFASIFLIAATVIAASVVEYIFVGLNPIFVIPDISVSKDYFLLLIDLVILISIGLMSGIISILFIRGIYRVEDIFHRFINNPYFRHVTGMMLIGATMYLMMKLFGHYYIEGTGLATIQDCFNLLLMNPWILVVLVVLKFLSTCVSLGSGASGGIFSPALFIGAAIGTLMGVIFQHFFPAISINLALFTIAGMAGVAGSTTGAIATAIILSFEMTRSFFAILPVMITVLIAYFIRRQFCRDSVYTLKLVRHGITLH